MEADPSTDNGKKIVSSCMMRRDLLKLPIPVCAMAVLGTTRLRGSTQQDEQEVRGETRLCTYCGIYCGLCDMYQGTAGKHGEELTRLLGYYGLEAERFTEDAEAYNSFQQVLQLVTERLSNVSPCKEGCDLFPNCEIRPCAEEKEVDTCGFCDEFPCDKIEAFSAQYQTIPNLERQKEIGLQAWADEMAALVEAGGSFAGNP